MPELLLNELNSNEVIVVLNVIIKILYSYKCRKLEKKLLSKVNKKLTLVEKRRIAKRNNNVATIMKTVYKDWDSCDYRYFVSDPYFQLELLPKLNDINYGKFGIRHKWSYFSDKNYQEIIASNFKFPEAIVRKINGDYYDNSFHYIDYNEALEKLKKYDSLVFKKSLGEGHGKGVKLVLKKDYEDEINSFGNNYVIQKKIKQHDFLANYNSSSVNVIRVTSLYIHGEVYILGSILRVGAPGSFCDHLGHNNVNPRIVSIADNGKLVGPAIDPDCCVVYDDLFGKKIDGKIPNYNEIIKTVKKEHKRFLHHKIIGWDITVDSDENVLCIEFNSNVPGIIQTQMANGPVFGELSSRGIPLLDEIDKYNN